MDQDIDFSRHRLSWTDPIRVGNSQFPVDHILARLGPMLTEERKKRLDEVVAARSLKVLPVLENIYDRGNVSAVMRSAEAFGFFRMHLIDLPGAKFKAANRVTKGAEKWLDIRAHSSPRESVEQLRAEGYRVWATDLNTEHSIDDLDWTGPVAIVLGNERDGVSKEMLDLVDGRFRIPMVGFSQSFNISVAAALIFYHAHLKLKELPDKGVLDQAQFRQVLANYYLRCFDNPEKLLELPH